jgi:Concanavalin A-like lectin/glucanases superfamily
MRSREHRSYIAGAVPAALRSRIVVARSAVPRVLTVGFVSFVLSLAWPTAGRAQTVVQHGVTEGTTSSLQLSLAFGSNTTAGDTAVATFEILSGTQTGTVTDSLGTTCYQGPHIDSTSAPGMDLEQWYCPNLAGGADTVTVTISGAVQRAVSLEIVELAGVLTSASVLDQSASLKNASSDTVVTGTTPTTTSASEIAIGAGGFAYAKTLSTGPANGSTLDNQSTAAPSLFTADQIVTSTGALSNSWTMTTGDVSLGLIGTYVATQPSATPTPTATATLTPTATVTATATPTVGIPQGGPLTAPLLLGGYAIDGSTSSGGDQVNNASVNGVINVMAYGATGTGIYGTDDAAALQSSVNAACASNNDADNHVSGSTVFLPPASYKMTYPLWENCAGVTLQGAGKFSSVLSPVYDFGPTVVYAAQAYPGVHLAAPLVGSVGNSFDFTQDTSYHPFVNLREWDGVNGAIGSPSGLNLNGLGAFSVETFAEDVTAGDGVIVSSSSTPSASAGESNTMLLRINGGDWDFYLTTTSGTCNVTGPSVTLNTVEYLAGTWDGSTCRLYVCTPGATNCAVAASAALSGTIVQPATDDVTIGPELEQPWPDGAPYNNAIDGKVYSVRLSNSARYTGTIGTAPNAAIAITGDANTLILTNGEQAPGGAPFYKAYDCGDNGGACVSGVAGYGYGWLFGYTGNRTSSGNYFNQQNGMRQMGIAGPVDNSGIISVGSHDSDFESLHFIGMEVGIELYQLSYEARNFSDIEIYGVPGRYGITDVGGGLNTWKGTKISNMWACVDGGDTWIGRNCIQGSAGSQYDLIANDLAGTNSEISDTDPIVDAENGYLFTPYLILANGAPVVVNVHGGQPVAEFGPIAILDSGGLLNMFGTQLISGAGSPTQIVQVTGSTTGSAVMTSPTFVGWGSAPLSSTAGVVTMTPCKGSVTLASGAGTFSNVCVTTTSVCSARDVTTPANAVTFGVPANGSVTLSGTGTDVIRLTCD